MCTIRPGGCSPRCVESEAVDVDVALVALDSDCAHDRFATSKRSWPLMVARGVALPGPHHCAKNETQDVNIKYIRL